MNCEEPGQHARLRRLEGRDLLAMRDTRRRVPTGSLLRLQSYIAADAPDMVCTLLSMNCPDALSRCLFDAGIPQCTAWPSFVGVPL